MTENDIVTLRNEVAAVKDEVKSIKKLLILYLVKMGATSEEIGIAIDLEASVVRKMLPSRGIKKFKGV